MTLSRKTTRRSRAGPRWRRAAGLTLIEVTIAISLLATIVMAVALSTQSASDTYQTEGLRATVDTRAHHVLDLVARELAEAERGTLTPDPLPALAGSTLTYRKSTGFAAGGATFGPWMRFALELEPGEVVDGLDNNGNGLADERMVAWTRNVGAFDEQRVVIAHRIPALLEGEVANGADDNGNGLDDEPGLVFSIDRDVLTVQLSVTQRDSQGRTFTKTVRTSTRVRN